MMRAFLLAAAALLVLSLGIGPAAAAEPCPALPTLGAPTLAHPARTAIVCHDYAALVDLDAKVPRWVAYTLTRAHAIGCVPRADDFHAEEQLGPVEHEADERAKPADYAKSGYDQGHMAPYEDLAWSDKAAHDSFSMANMAPQLGGLNRQEWERLEETVRALAHGRGDLTLYVGPVLPVHPKTIGKGRVAVPSAFWKVLVDETAGEAIGFAMPQQAIPKGDLTPFVTAIGEIEIDAGIRLPLPAAIDRQAHPKLWAADVAAYRRAHAAACGGRR